MKATLTSPHFWLAILLWSLFLAGTGYWSGIEAAREDAMLEEQARTVQAIQQVIDADAKVLANEKDLREQDRQRFTTYREEQENAQVKKDRLVADLRSGAIRLRIPVSSVCSAAPDGSGPVAARVGEETRAELSGAAAEFLTGEAASCDSAVRQLNAVIDTYEAVSAATKQAGSMPLSAQSPSGVETKPYLKAQSNVRTTP